MTDESLIHKGHRQRMRERLMTHGSRVMQSYELLEMLLFYVIPYKNTNPIAKKLLNRFGSLDGVLSASSRELCEVEGVGEAVADFIVNIASLIDDKVPDPDRAALDNYRAVGEFLVERLSSLTESRCVMLIFDNKMNLIDYSVIYEQDYSSGGVKPEAFINKAIKMRSSVVITAHNHPYGPLFPTVGDMATNSAITSAFSLAGITHVEHYVVCGDKYMGISQKFALTLGQPVILERFYKSREKMHNG